MASRTPNQEHARRHLASIEAVLEAHAPATSPYVTALASDDFGAAHFFTSQVQFGFAVRAFSKPLAALAARSDDVEQRFVFVDNLWDEHGEGDLTKSHAATFALFLERLVAAASLDKDGINVKAGPAVTTFNQMLFKWANEGDILEAAASLGMIERLFADYSRLIAQAVVARGWLGQAELAHYTLHEEKDHEHANGLFGVAAALEPAAFERALRRGADAFSALYAALAKV